MKEKIVTALDIDVNRMKTVGKPSKKTHSSTSGDTFDDRMVVGGFGSSYKEKVRQMEKAQEQDSEEELDLEELKNAGKNSPVGGGLSTIKYLSQTLDPRIEFDCVFH